MLIVSPYLKQLFDLAVKSTEFAFCCFGPLLTPAIMCVVSGSDGGRKICVKDARASTGGEGS